MDDNKRKNERKLRAIKRAEKRSNRGLDSTEDNAFNKKNDLSDDLTYDDEERYKIHRKQDGVEGHQEDRKDKDDTKMPHSINNKKSDSQTTKTSQNHTESDSKKQRKENNNKLSFSSLKNFNSQRKSKKQEKQDKYEGMSLQEKREQQRIERRKRQKQIQYTVITILVLLILLFLIYMFTPLSRIAHINITGNKNVSNSQIKKALDIKDNSRMYTYSKKKSINNLEKNDLIKNVEIDKQLPNIINVKVTENEVVGIVKEKNKYVPIIEGNKELKNYNGDIAGSGPILDDFKGDDKDNIIKALSNMSSDIRDMISEIKYAPEQNNQNRILLFMKDDMQVVGNIDTIAKKIQYYPQMSQSLSRDDSGNLKTRGYIDLSVGASFIPYEENNGSDSKSDQNVRQKSQEEIDAKDELQSALNKINEQSDSNN
ncbi:cell division protein FtsQ/DivIB [Staphylococcus devriesei]|uniref:Cell division protein DivIB n=1 Tax=Staphylococcus devriesei TaxID=586733 RepID=A0ABX5I0A6_9STAP|nr:FtsQ-type POTRA domain-containing protein [Staphylococcus devriesei]PNZ87469.1 cell division protein FtsQ [Staphylococcus devriesei]PTF13155.1 cell division protein FtsQ [Staphylococcus devriesei]PTF20406.1 cell division protein FtsQ [Staphylococcus devriesei]SUM03821.1 Cell division protein ftsQ [Staphylococcus devriesei]